MNASLLLRSAFVTLAAVAVGVGESNAQVPTLYSPYVPVTTSVYSTVAPAPVYGTQWGTTPAYGNYYNNGVGYNNGIGVGGCYSPSTINNSAYRPQYPYGTASNDWYWNSGVHHPNFSNDYRSNDYRGSWSHFGNNGSFGNNNFNNSSSNDWWRNDRSRFDHDHRSR